MHVVASTTIWRGMRATTPMRLIPLSSRIRRPSLFLHRPISSVLIDTAPPIKAENQNEIRTEHSEDNQNERKIEIENGNRKEEEIGNEKEIVKEERRRRDLPTSPYTNETHIASVERGTENGNGKGLENENEKEIRKGKRRELPISPYMNETHIRDVSKFRAPEPKKKPFGLGSVMREQLNRNCYAQALATPIRQCNLTRIRLPSFFLQDFTLVLHPETGTPHYLPRSLGSKISPSPSPQHEGESELDIEENEREGSDPSNTEIETISPPKIQPTTETKKSTSPLGPRTFTLSRHLLINQLNLRPPPKASIKNRHLNAYNRFPPIGEFVKTRQWREDMADWVLELRRRRVAEWLGYLVERRGYVVPCRGEGLGMGVWEDVRGKKQVAAVLSCGGVGGVGGEDGEKDEEGISEFRTIRIGRTPASETSVPLYDLHRLLGPEKLVELREKYPGFFGEGTVVAVKGKRVTEGVLGMLWGLEGFIGGKGFGFGVDDGNGERREGRRGGEREGRGDVTEEM